MKLTLCFPYYENPDMFQLQQSIWESYPAKYRDMFGVIIVDDGSQKAPAIDAVLPGSYNARLYRIKVDIPWNQTSARNLAVYEADKDSWLFLTDMDHILDKDNFTYLMYLLMNSPITVNESQPCPDKQYHYTFDRLNGPEKTPYKYHPNSFLMHQSLYRKVGGYDEEFAGQVYATDGMFRKTLNKESKGHTHIDNIKIIRYGREHMADASTRNLKRGKDFQTAEAAQAVKNRFKIKQARGERPRVLSFPWERLI